MRYFAEVLKRIAFGAYESSVDTAARTYYALREIDIEEIPILSTADWFLRGLTSCVYNEGRSAISYSLESCFPQYYALIEDD